jgi:GNAT superfamily N-acetyltransferase
MGRDLTTLKIISGLDNRDLLKRADRMIGGEWPEFMLHDPVAEYLDDCYEKLPEYQYVITTEDQKNILAVGNTIPLSWKNSPDNLPDEGWDWALTKGIEDYNSKKEATCLCALQIVVFKDYRGQGLSFKAVEAMKEIGRKHNLTALIAPVRPSRKSDYPLTDISDYITWINKNNLPYDPWLRVHKKLGAEIIKPCPKAMNICGSIAEWESWTGLHFPESGKYIVPGALVPVEINVEKNIGRYIEPNVWMYHPL